MLIDQQAIAAFVGWAIHATGLVAEGDGVGEAASDASEADSDVILNDDASGSAPSLPPLLPLTPVPGQVAIGPASSALRHLLCLICSTSSAGIGP